MSRNDFEELLRKKMNEEELTYNPEHWEQLARRLARVSETPSIPLQYHRKYWWPAGIAAAALLAVATAFFWFDTPNSSTVPSQVISKTTQPALQNNTPAVSSPEQDNPAPQHYLQPATYAGAPTGTAGRLPSRPSNPVYAPRDSVPAGIALPDQHQSSREIPSEQPGASLLQDSKTTGAIAAHKNSNPLPQSSSANPDPYFNSYTLLQQHPEGRTSLAVGGGVNYGTFKTGVTFGISARQYIGKKVFVDGTVAMNINQGNDNTLHYTGNVMSDLLSGNNNTRSRPSGHFYQANDFYYIQINPTVGYKLSRKFSLSAGPDFQQLLRDGSNNAIMFLNDDVKIIPDMDMGVTGRAEFSITPNIQSGITYREGLNNFIRNNDNFLNRRYIQVQMRFTVPLDK